MCRCTQYKDLIDKYLEVQANCQDEVIMVPKF